MTFGVKVGNSTLKSFLLYVCLPVTVVNNCSGWISFIQLVNVLVRLQTLWMKWPLFLGGRRLLMNVLSCGMCSVVCFHPLATLPVFHPQSSSKHLVSNNSKAHVHAWILNGPQEGNSSLEATFISDVCLSLRLQSIQVCPSAVFLFLPLSLSSRDSCCLIVDLLVLFII